MAILGFSSSVPLHISTVQVQNRKHTIGAKRHQVFAVLSSRRTRRAENVTGDIFVDSSCIDCDTCRWLAPATFHRDNGQSAVHAQPTDEASRIHALAAAAACPTSSIRSDTEKSAAVKYAKQFPMPIEKLPDNAGGALKGLYYLGMTNENTFGASSWLIVEEDGTGVMMDVPRYSESMAKRIESLCDELTYMVLSHRDDVADHERWAKRLNAKRVIHEVEATTSQGTVDCEIQLRDNQFPYKLKDGFELVHLPGHTIGCIALLHERTKSLFTGDHLFYSRKRHSFVPSPQFTWYSWNVLCESMKKTADLPFLHGWPAHGGHFHFENDEDRRAVLDDVVKTMKRI